MCVNWTQAKIASQGRQPRAVDAQSSATGSWPAPTLSSGDGRHALAINGLAFSATVTQLIAKTEYVRSISQSAVG